MYNKHELILKYVAPALGVILSKDDVFIDQLTLHSRLTTTVKHQQIETPGFFEDAYAWFSIDAMIHSYYYCPHKLVKKGTRIWKKREFILFTACLLENQFRTDYLETLESGLMISIKYDRLFDLIGRYTELEKQVKLVSINNERSYHNRSLLLNKPPIERVKQLRAENPLFLKCTNHTTQGTHVNLTRNGYEDQLKKINKDNN